jgi:hypothetical protein
MSLNKVLNRPMFRKEALKKGALKPIRANVGIMVGSPYTPPGTPAVVPGQGVFSPVNTQRLGPPRPTRMQNFMRNPAVRLTGRMLSLPALVGGTATGVLADAMGMQDSPYKTGLQLAGAYGATRVPALAALSGIGMGPQLGIAALGGAGYYAYQKAQEQKARIAAMSPKEREEFFAQQRGEALAGEAALPTDQELFGKFIPKAPDAFKPKVDARPGSGRVGFDKNKLKQQGDELLEEKYASVDGDANLNSIQADALGQIGPVPPGEQPPQLGGSSTVAQAEAVTKGQTPKLTTAEKKALETEDKKITENIINTGGVSGDPSFDQTIKLAKKYYDEVYSNKGSQANLIFLANLASGLLTGTTRKAGVGGAMEVLGQAIGPAVNNYVTVKLKEGELRQSAREASLNAALDHMKFVNDNARVDRPEQTGGIVQVRGADGRLRNYKAYQMKDGTVTMAAGVGPDGRESFMTVPQGEAIVDSDGNTIGNFENFLPQTQIDKRLFDIQDTLGNRYNAYSVTRDVLNTLNQLDESGELVKAGAGLAIDQFTRRLSGVAKEILGFDIGSMSEEELKQRVQQLQADELDALERDPDITDSEKERLKKQLNSDSLIAEAKKRILKNTGDKGWFSGLSRGEQERLAVQETTLVYALANTFKDQDRLTQRDIDAARNIVNIFSMTRSSKDVKASIEAISRQLESDIRRQEGLYTQAGGLETTLRDLRKLKEFQQFETTKDLTETLLGDLGIKEIEEGLAGVQL